MVYIVTLLGFASWLHSDGVTLKKVNIPFFVSVSLPVKLRQY